MHFFFGINLFLTNLSIVFYINQSISSFAPHLLSGSEHARVSRSVKLNLTSDPAAYHQRSLQIVHQGKCVAEYFFSFIHFSTFGFRTVGGRMLSIEFTKKRGRKVQNDSTKLNNKPKNVSNRSKGEKNNSPLQTVSSSRRKFWRNSNVLFIKRNTNIEEQSTAKRQCDASGIGMGCEKFQKGCFFSAVSYLRCFCRKFSFL